MVKFLKNVVKMMKCLRCKNNGILNEKHWINLK